jgi:hypothetical protein
MPQLYPTYEEIHQLLADTELGVELLAALDRPDGLDELTRKIRGRQSEANSYAVRCDDCGQWETVCVCDEVQS